MGNVLTHTSNLLMDRQGGAARLSIFFALWSLALVLLHDARVEAAPVLEHSQPPAVRFATLTPVPEPRSNVHWDQLAEHSEVISGRWQRTPTTASHTAVGATRTPNESGESPRSAPRPDEVDAHPVVAIKSASATTSVETDVAQLITRGDWAGAAAAISDARSTGSTSEPRLRLLDAHLAIASGESERAYGLLVEALPDVRVSTEQHDLLASVMLRTARNAEAAAIYRALLSIDARNARWWAGYAAAAECLGQRAEAIGAYRALASVAPSGSALASWADARLERET